MFMDAAQEYKYGKNTRARLLHPFMCSLSGYFAGRVELERRGEGCLQVLYCFICMKVTHKNDVLRKLDWLHVVVVEIGSVVWMLCGFQVVGVDLRQTRVLVDARLTISVAGVARFE